MNKILARYAEDECGRLQHDPNGNLVGIEDFEALQKECKRLESKLADTEKENVEFKRIINLQIFKPSHPLDALSYNELQDKVVELEAEAKAVRIALEKVRQVMIDRGHSVYTLIIDEALKGGGQ